MLLLLRRSPEQEVELRQLLAAQRQAGSPEYHRWLTPEQFGQRFGPAASDVATIETWLEAQGFSVEDVSPGGLVIAFSGTAAEVQQALHTAMHRYEAQRPDGTWRSYWANASDPAIPAALAPVVGGVVSLNNFFSRPVLQVVGQGTGHKATVLDPTPELTFTNNGVTQHALVPGDFDTIYNVNPLFTQGIHGKGETIAIVSRSDILTSNFDNFRNLFQPTAPANTLTVIHATTTDPGIATNGDQIEATLDTEWASAAAPDAALDLVVAASSEVSDGIELAALYIVNHDLAPVMDVSYGLCEPELTSAGNQFMNSLWQQAAAEGITVAVSAGDNGAAGCDPNTATSAQGGLAVSGMASTPYDTAVGGTEFDENGNDAAFWGANQADFTSALGYIPEQPWDEPSSSPTSGGLDAGSGGASTVYALPFWQRATGIAADETARLLPDVSFTAASGHDGYVICLDNDCQPNSQGQFSFEIVGGTSAAAPAFAGVMALVDQKTGGAQGLANPVLYRLASTSDVYHDITSGSNDVHCVVGTPDCTTGELGFNAAAGYDEATGLGSINVANLISGWGNVTFAASQTVLQPLPANATVGQSVAVAITVSGSSGGPTPTGTVDLLAEFSDGTKLEAGSFTLSGGAVSGSTTALPGGTYNVVAQYEGDANYGPSTSAAVSVTVAKATPTLSVQLFNSFSQQPITALIFGDTLQAFTSVSGPTGAATATGTVSVSASATQTFGSSAVEPPGVASVIATFAGAPGSYQFTANYSGDNSYNPGSAAASLTVAASPTTMTATQSDATHIAVLLATQSQGAFPTVAPQVFDGSTAIGTVTLGAPAANAAGFQQASGTFTLPSPLPAPGTITVQYGGETGFLASKPAAVTVSGYTLAVSGPATVSAGQTANYTVTATPEGGFNGTVTLSCSSGLPSGATCSAKPVTLDGTNAAAIALAIATTARTNGVVAPGSGPLEGQRLLWLLGLLAAAGWLLAERRERVAAWVRVGGLAMLLLAMTACGGGSSAPPPPPPPQTTGTPAGQYTITVVGTATGQPQVTTTVVLKVN